MVSDPQKERKKGAYNIKKREQKSNKLQKKKKGRKTP
jgi:hypothetical protein